METASKGQHEGRSDTEAVSEGSAMVQEFRKELSRSMERDVVQSVERHPVTQATSSKSSTPDWQPPTLSAFISMHQDIRPKEHDIKHWQGTSSARAEWAEGDIVQRLYKNCVAYFSILLQAFSKEPGYDHVDIARLRRNFNLLRIWGEAYSVSDGGLDGLSKDAPDVSETILDFLMEIASILSKRLINLKVEQVSDEEDTLTRASTHVRALVKEAQENLINDGAMLGEESSESADSESSFTDTISQCAADIDVYVQLLNDLHTAIESFVPLVDGSENESTRHRAIKQEPYQWYSDEVWMKFPSAADELVELLGKQNRERYNRMIKDRDLALQHASTALFSTGKPGSSLTFVDSGLGSSIPSHISFPQSAPSLFSSLAGDSRSKLPALPDAAKKGLFACDYCGKSLRIGTKREWHRHVIKDLRPYSCLDYRCPQNSDPFLTRAEWMEHLGKEHGFAPKWESQICPLCQQETESGRIGVCKHFGDHLEDIAIASLPRDVDSDGESDTDSLKSHGRLSTIGETSGFGSDDQQSRSISERSDHSEAEETEQRAAVKEFQLNPKATAFEPASSSNQIPVSSPSKPQRPPIEFNHDLSMFDEVPTCTFCSSAVTDCSCESERLQVALNQAEHRYMESRLSEIRDWVIAHARQHVLNQFQHLTSKRKAAHEAHLATLPYYSIYKEYSGHPPIHPAYLQTLQGQIAEAHAEHKRGIDADWRVSVLRYPEVMDYFYGLVELRLPSERSPQVTEPKIGAFSSDYPKYKGGD